MGLIYKAIQYLHYDTNFLTKNPMEQDEAFLQPLDWESFAEAVGVNRQYLHRIVSTMTYPCQYKGMELELMVFARVKTGKYTFIKLNPFVAWRKAGDPPTNVYAEFIMEYNKRAE